jgi:hypothetical protein
MPEIEIKRVNFFDGQFLHAAELNDLNNYAVHMQRRLLFTLFNRSGVVGADDLKVVVPNAGQKKIQVKAGMAIVMRPDLVEAHEIILGEDSTIDLTTASAAVAVPLQAHDKAIVTIHYEETLDGGASPNNSRINEKAVLLVHRNDLPQADPSKPPLIELARVEFDTMRVTTDQRATAQIKAGLVGGRAVTAQPGATITGIAPKQAVQGTSLPITVSGSNLSGTSQIVFSNSRMTVQAVQSTPSGQLGATLTIARDAAPGPATFTLVTPGGLVANGQVTFTVLQRPEVSAIISSPATAGQAIKIRGSNIRDSNIPAGQPAVGTTIEFLDPGSNFVFATGTSPTVDADVGTVQEVGVVIPAQWNPAPLINPVTVDVRLTFKEASVVVSNGLVVKFGP